MWCAHIGVRDSMSPRAVGRGGLLLACAGGTSTQEAPRRQLMRSASDVAERIAFDLIALLHQGAPPDEFAQRLASAEALADAGPGKSALVETVRMAMAVRNRIELLQERERGLLAVIESAQDLSSRLEYKSLLSAIVSRA